MFICDWVVLIGSLIVIFVISVFFFVSGVYV